MHHLFSKSEEQSLVRKMVLGDDFAFKVLFEKYKNPLYNFSLKLTKSEELAEEIVHDVFLKIWNLRGKINPELSFQALIYKITKNESLNFLKKAASDLSLKRHLLLYFEKFHNETEDYVIFSDYEDIALKAIKLLPPQQQLVYKLSRLDGKTHEEISEELQLSKGTVKNHMGLALKFIKKYLSLHTDIVPSILLAFCIVCL
jgi:RNA polymerase sigma-70 factor (family 1)